MFGSGRSRIRPPIPRERLLEDLDEVSGRHSADVRKKKRLWTRVAKVFGALTVVCAVLSVAADAFALFGIKPIPTWFEPGPPPPDLVYEPDEDYKARNIDVDDLDLRGSTGRHRFKMLLELLKDPSEAKDRDFQDNFEQLLAEEAGCATWVSTHFHVLHGRWELKLGRHRPAIKDFEKALELDSSNWHAKKFLVEVYENRIKALDGTSLPDQLELKELYERTLKRLKSELASQVAEFIMFVDTRGRDDPNRLMVGNQVEIRNKLHYEDSAMKVEKQTDLFIEIELLYALGDVAYRPEKRQFLAIGLDEPWDLSSDLSATLDFAENDARRLAHTLRDFGFEGREVIGPQVTWDNIFGSLAEISLGSRPGDELIIYLAGHGISSGDGNRGLVISRSADRSLEAITTPAIIRALETYRGEATIVLDACLNSSYSGPFHPFYATNPLLAKPASSPTARKEGGHNVNLIFATQDGSKAVESRRFGGGIFTQSLLDFLKKEPKSHFDAEAACRYTTSATQKYAKGAFGISQVPNCELRENQLN